MSNVIAGLIGLVILFGYLGMMVWSVASLPFTLIVAVSVAILLYDFYLSTLRGNRPRRRGSSLRQYLTKFRRGAARG